MSRVHGWPRRFWARPTADWLVTTRMFDTTVGDNHRDGPTAPGHRRFGDLPYSSSARYQACEATDCTCRAILERAETMDRTS